jgi:hypothetical protein
LIIEANWVKSSFLDFVLALLAWLPAPHESVKSLNQAITVRKRFPSGRHLQPTLFVYEVVGGTRALATPGGMFKAINLFVRQLLEHPEE